MTQQEIQAAGEQAISDVVRLYSVTSLIDAGTPKTALLNWVGRTVAEYAVDKRAGWLPLADEDRDAAVDLLVQSRFKKTKQAGERGTVVHAAAEQVALGLDPDEEFLPAHFTQYKRFLAEHAPEFLAAEASVVNLTYSYAGTLDNIIRIGGRICVLDVKTTDKGPDAKSRPPYGEAALQVCAYSRAEKICLTPLPRIDTSGRGRYRYYSYSATHPQDDMPTIEGGLVLVVSPVDYLLVPVRITDDVFTAFLNVREVARWKIEGERHAFGPPLAPARAIPQTFEQMVAEAREVNLATKGPA